MWAQELSCFSPVWLFVKLWTVAHQAPLSMGSSRQEHWEWVAMPSSKGSSWPRDQTHISCGFCIAGGLFTTETLGKPKQKIEGNNYLRWCDGTGKKYGSSFPKLRCLFCNLFDRFIYTLCTLCVYEFVCVHNKLKL